MLSPGPLEELAPEIEAAADRGVELMVKAYRPIAIEGVEVVVDYRNDEPLENWDGDWLNLVADGKEYVLSFFGEGGRRLHQGVWSNSAYLSWIFYCGLAAEMAVDRVRRAIDEGQGVEEIQRILESHRPDSEKKLGDAGLGRKKGST